MTREAGATRRVANGMRERPRGSIPDLPPCRCWERCHGARTLSALDLFPGSPPLGKLHVPPSSWTSRRLSRSREAARTLDPRQSGNLRSLGKRPHLLEPLPPSELRTEQWADRPMPVQWGNLCPCFLPVNSVDGCERLLPVCRQEIGVFLTPSGSCLSVHLIDRCPAREQVCGAVRVVSRSPYSGQVFSAWGKGVKSCGLVLDR
jgi:hypothetical protein